MPNETMSKFGYPNSVVREFEHWVVLLRPEQVTLGSLVLVSKTDASALSDLPTEAFTELAIVTSNLEGALRASFSYDKINYLLLMMVDKHVHFHVLPRYDSTRDLDGNTYPDEAWPGPPDLSVDLDLTDAQSANLLETLKSAANAS